MALLRRRGPAAAPARLEQEIPARRVAEGLEVVASREEPTARPEWRAGQRWSVRTRVVEETITRVVTVRREELVVEPIELSGVERLELSMGLPGADAGAAELEIVLHREEVVTEVRTVPYERVRVRRELVAEDLAIPAQARTERVDVEQRAVEPSTAVR